MGDEEEDGDLKLGVSEVLRRQNMFCRNLLVEARFPLSLSCVPVPGPDSGPGPPKGASEEAGAFMANYLGRNQLGACLSTLTRYHRAFTNSSHPVRLALSQGAEST